MLRALPTIRRFAPDFLVTMVAEFGDVVSFPVPGRAVFLAGSPQAAHDILITDPHAWTKQTPQYLSLARLTGAGLLTADGDAWLRHRRILGAAYARSGLDAVRELSVAAAERVELPEAGGFVDVQEVFNLLSLEILGGAVLGADLRERASSLVRSVVLGLDCVIADVEAPQPLPGWVTTPRRRRFAAAQRHIDAAARELLAARRGVALGCPGPGDLLGLLVQAVDSGEMSGAQARDELVTTIVAGHETVASSMTWTLWLLAGSPHWQDRARDDEGVMKAAVWEGLRLCPPAWVMSRRSIRQTIVAGQSIPKDAMAIISPWQLHRRADGYPDPGAFDPSRFLQRQPPVKGYLPFGAGARLCIGRDVALTESIAVLSTLLRRAHFRPSSPDPVRRAGVTLTSRNGVRLLVQPR